MIFYLFRTLQNLGWASEEWGEPTSPRRVPSQPRLRVHTRLWRRLLKVSEAASSDALSWSWWEGELVCHTRYVCWNVANNFFSVSAVHEHVERSNWKSGAKRGGQADDCGLEDEERGSRHHRYYPKQFLLIGYLNSVWLYCHLRRLCTTIDGLIELPMLISYQFDVHINTYANKTSRGSSDFYFISSDRSSCSYDKPFKARAAPILRFLLSPRHRASIVASICKSGQLIQCT